MNAVLLDAIAPVLGAQRRKRHEIEQAVWRNQDPPRIAYQGLNWSEDFRVEGACSPFDLGVLRIAQRGPQLTRKGIDGRASPRSTCTQGRSWTNDIRGVARLREPVHDAGRLRIEGPIRAISMSAASDGISRSMTSRLIGRTSARKPRCGC